MKKFLFLITSILAISSACLAGCNMKQSGNGEQNPEEKTYEVTGENLSGNENECPDGKCKKDGEKCPDNEKCPEDKDEDEKTAPDFLFRPHHFGDMNDENNPDAPEFHLRRLQNRRDRTSAEGRALTDENEDNDKDNEPAEPHPEHRNPRRRDRTPEPKPMPLKPKTTKFSNI